MTPLMEWTDEETVTHLIWHFYQLNRDRLKRIFSGQEELKEESIIYYYLGECRSIIERLRGFKYDTGPMERELKELYSTFRVFRNRQKGDFSAKVRDNLREIVSEHLEWIETYKRASVKEKRITDAWDETEIEMGLFDLREWFEYAVMGIEATQETLFINDLKKSIAEYDAVFRELVPIAFKHCSERGWIVQRPDIFPELFWWRKMAWETVLNEETPV